MPDRTPIEELDLSVRAYNLLKANGVNFVYEIRPYLDAADHPLARTNEKLQPVRHEIEERLRRWGDDPGGAGARRDSDLTFRIVATIRRIA